ncbi:hypothetical protein [Advenella sp. FME57]|uniref:hypothetical protein n=1 Tax=Advenella sp. FME57 TaxID=2742604 RepID=UPI0018695AEF|nr:hypothetical protein [Advenella sp. FME57]
MEISLGALLEFLCPERTALIFKILSSVRDSNITPVSKNFNITFSPMPAPKAVHATVFGNLHRKHLTESGKRTVSEKSPLAISSPRFCALRLLTPSQTVVVFLFK